MRMLSQTDVYISKYISENKKGEQVGGYTDLLCVPANVQYMSNEIEHETYGQITNSIIEIRLENEPNAVKGDYIYLSKPTKKGTFVIGTKTYDNYGIGEYIIESIKTTYVGTNKNVKNRTRITAKKVGV